MQPIYLVCGVPGSGKTWVCEKLSQKYKYVRHDDFIHGDYVKALIYEAKNAQKPVLADCPFAERALRDALEAQNAVVKVYIIVEDPQLIKRRYEARDKKPIPPAHITRAISIKKRVLEWKVPHGTSEEVLHMLNGAV